MWVGLNLDFNLRAHHGFSVIEVAANSIHDYRKVIKEIESGGFGTYAIASGYREYQYIILTAFKSDKDAMRFMLQSPFRTKRVRCWNSEAKWRLRTHERDREKAR